VLWRGAACAKQGAFSGRVQGPAVSQARVVRQRLRQGRRAEARLLPLLLRRLPDHLHRYEEAAFCSVVTQVFLPGNLDKIALIISDCFLVCYALVNYACFDASFSGSPGFRPGFKYYNQWVALFAAVVCVVIMFIIKWESALVALGLVLALYMYILYRKPGTFRVLSIDYLTRKVATCVFLVARDYENMGRLLIL